MTEHCDLPLVSIIIPTYNRAEKLERALKSVVAQTYPHWECIVIDNHSIDNTEEVIKKINHAKIKLLKIHNHGVIAASRNLGIRHADGEFIAFLDSDDWWAPLKLERSVDYLRQGADVVFHSLWRVRKLNQRIFLKKVKAWSLSTPVYHHLITHGDALPNSSVVLKTELLADVNALSEDLRLIAAEDYDCWLRIAKRTDKFVFIPEVLGYCWLGGGGTTNPKLVSVYLNRVYEVHISPWVKSCNTDSPLWWEYRSARAFYLIGETEVAKKHLKCTIKRSYSLTLLLKASLMLCILNISHAFKGKEMS